MHENFVVVAQLKRKLFGMMIGPRAVGDYTLAEARKGGDEKIPEEERLMLKRFAARICNKVANASDHQKIGDLAKVDDFIYAFDPTGDVWRNVLPSQ